MSESQFVAWLLSAWPWLLANWPSVAGSLLMSVIYLRLNRFLDRFYKVEMRIGRQQIALNLLLSKCEKVTKEEIQELLGEGEDK